MTATLTPAADAPAYSYLSWFIDGSLYSTYYLNGTTWYEYDTFTGTYSHATTESAAQTQALTFATEGSHTVTCRVYDSTLAELASPSATATITGQYSTVTNVTATGFVYDVTTGTTIPGATVSAAQPTVGFSDSDTADASGYFSIAGLKPDFPVSFTTAATNYTSQTVQYTGVPQATTWPITLYLFPTAAPAGASLYGQVYASGTSQGIAGATVGITNGSYSDSTTTSSAGFYEFADLSEGTYTLTATATGHDAVSESVSVGSSATQHNVAMTGHYTLTVTAKDATTSATIATTTVTFSLTDGQEKTSATGSTSFTVTAGSYTVTAAAEGYYPSTAYAYVDRDTTATIFLTAIPEPTEAPDYPNFPPHNVRFHCIDDYGGPLSNVSVSAEYLETTSPWSWFGDLLGIPSAVKINETTLSGTTGSDGSITFSMVEVVRYAISAHDPASNLTVNFTLYPQETAYTIQFRSRPAPAAAEYPLYELNAVPQAEDTQASLQLAYRDRDNGTSTLTFWVKDAAGELVHSSGLTPAAYNWTNASYTVENQPTSYTWGFDATHATYNDITAARTITLHGSGRLVDLGFDDDFWYYLLSAVWIVLIGAIFSGSRVRFGAIIIPLIGGGIPTLIGWLPPTTAVLIGILTFIGVFAYMRKSEYKLYR